MNQDLKPQFALHEFSTSPKSNSIKHEQGNIKITHTHITQKSSEIQMAHNELLDFSNQRALEIDSHLQFRNNLTTNIMISGIVEARTQNHIITTINQNIQATLIQKDIENIKSPKE